MQVGQNLYFMKIQGWNVVQHKYHEQNKNGVASFEQRKNIPRLCRMLRYRL